MPLYEQLRDDMLSKMATGQWRPGQRIPSEVELCEVYGVSRVTVRRAIEDLVKTGRLNRYRGKGTFVKREFIEKTLSKFYSFSESLKSKGIKENVVVLAFETVTADGILRGKMTLFGVNPSVHKITRLRSIEEIPYAVETSYVPEMLFPNLSEALIVEKGLYKAMHSLGVAPNHATETFWPSGLDEMTSQLLLQALGTPAMEIERLTYADNACVEYCRSVIRGDFFTYTVELGY